MEEQQRMTYLGVVVKESERLTRLINQVLDLAKIESGQAEWQVIDLDPMAAIDDALTSTGQLFEEKHVRLDVSVPATLPMVRGDHDRVVQVLINLLSNAVKFSEETTGRVQVAVSVPPGYVQVSVSDNGPGIRSEEQGMIFEKFRQAGDTLTEKPMGTGLGLPISHHIIAHLGGRLWVESVPGEGSVFSFTLPVVGGLTPGDTGEPGSAVPALQPETRP
jgi:signal transduction histidine kinase